MKKIGIMMVCLMLALCLVACGGEPATSTPVGGENSTDVSTVPGDTVEENSNTADLPSDGNVVDGGAFFEDVTTTTTTTTGSKDTTTQQGDAPTTTTTAPTTTITTTKKPTTTVAPPVQEEIKSVKLPKAGYDPDGRGRIVVEDSEVKKEGKQKVAYITFANVSTKSGGKGWIIPEYSQVTYACYDKKGNEIKGTEEDFGIMFLGSLEANEKVTCQFVIPDGTEEIIITGHNLEYWTPWS